MYYYIAFPIMEARGDLTDIEAIPKSYNIQYTPFFQFLISYIKKKKLKK